MFFMQEKQKENEIERNWRSKTYEFQKDQAKKDRSNKIQSQRYLQYIEVIDWRMNIDSFRNKVEKVCNYYNLINTLFAISQEVDWRLYIQHMILLVSTFHNTIYVKIGPAIQDINKIKDFQVKFQKLFLLKDLTLHKHLMLLLKMLLALNGKYQFMRETKFAEILAQSAIYNDVENMSQVLWIIAQIQVSSLALVKLAKQQSLSYSIQRSEKCLLALLTIIANFISNPNESQEVIKQFLTSNIFQKAFQLGLLNKTTEIINETVLIFNNGICFSSEMRQILLKQKKIIQIIMGSQCQQKHRSQQILAKLGFISLTIS